ncbi:hypothetical protein BT67DRAFT_445215 [Trichocladium antarcticum]|uniref:Uncharacterized protein n=1 Tax=Trichocladium antarcticum TaxID=1450529 RepID=A0AAN6UDS0_9PEZI|nr:hypothetical protein BT67DRAFT_445215 [Trichocladium antarcticum]
MGFCGSVVLDAVCQIPSLWWCGGPDQIAHPKPMYPCFSTNRPLRQPTHKAALADADLSCGFFASSAPPGTHPFQIPGATTVVSNGHS